MADVNITIQTTPPANLSVQQGNFLGIGPGSVTATQLAPTLDLSSKSLTLPSGVVSNSNIAPAGLDTSVLNWSAIAEWQPSTAYAKGALVSYLGVGYRRSAAGTSGTTFNTANWQQITPTTTIPSDGSVTPVKLSQPLTQGTVKASTSGTSVDFTGIPSWAKRITVIFSGVSTSGTSPFQLQLGTSSGFVTTGYQSSGNNYGSGTSVASTSGILLNSVVVATSNYYGSATILNVTGNTWAGNGTNAANASGSNAGGYGGGGVTLSASLDRLRVTMLNGTDTFDAGQINIMYE